MGGENAAEFERGVVELLKRCEERREPQLVWTAEVAKCVVATGVELPSPELGEVLASRLCDNFVNPFLWKFLDQAFASRLVSSFHVLALLFRRILSDRQSQPEAYRLFLELISRYIFSYRDISATASREKIIKSVDAAMQLSQSYEVPITELGHAYVLFFFSTVVGLIDITMGDLEFQTTTLDGSSGVHANMDIQRMDIDSKVNQNEKRVERRESMKRTNFLMTLEILDKVTESKKGATLLRIIHLNMPEKLNGLLKRLRIDETCKPAVPNLVIARQTFVKLSTNITSSLASEGRLNKRTVIEMLIDNEPCNSGPCWNPGFSLPSCWVAFDIYMECAMDQKQLPVASAVDVLTEIVITLQVLNQATWKETFLALWISGLRLVEREHDPPEGPVPRLDARLSILLSIVPQTIAQILKDNAIVGNILSQNTNPLTDTEMKYEHRVDGKIRTSMRDDHISAIQLLGQFSSLLCPPETALHAANMAAAKAAHVISVSKNGSGGLNSDSTDGRSVRAGGNMLHLIVEACITRNLIDVSAYFWPGYVSVSDISPPDSPLKEMSSWSKFMEGAPLTEPLISSLITTPATSLSEIEKVYHIALNGSEEEKIEAAKILCGASLSNGWNIQEHVVNFVVKLLSPPAPPGHDGKPNYLIDHMPLLSVVLFGAFSVDSVHVLSLHGLLPEVAAALMPLCEAFGSVSPAPDSQSETRYRLSVSMVFSAAFLVLLRLWKFYRPAFERGLRNRDGPIGVGLSLEYLLQLRNRRFPLAKANFCQDEIPRDLDQGNSPLDKPIYIDFFPKLRAWYCQNNVCIASPLSGLSAGSPVHQVADKIISMIYSKVNVGGHSADSSAPTSDASGGSPSVAGEEASVLSRLPAWELLEAIPYALESLLTACAYGKLSSRHLTTGLRDLVDIFPASIASIVSYFSAEIIRAVWKLVPMNGIDWPSPAQMLPKVQSDMKEILAAAGVSVPIHPSDGIIPMLPLPMAALVSLTITFKLERNLEYILAVAGPALENCAMGCSLFSMPIIGSLWAHKARRWHKFIVYTCCRSVFRENKEAIAQLLRSCFTSFLGTHNGRPDSLFPGQGSIYGLLGGIHSQGVLHNSSPGFLYLRSCRRIQEVEQVNAVIVGLVAEFAREYMVQSSKTTSARLRSGRSSLSTAAAWVRGVSSLGACLLSATGGPYLVYELFCKTIPTWLLMTEDAKLKEVSYTARMVEGYAVAFMVLRCGAFTGGIKGRLTSWGFSTSATRTARVVSSHMDFLAAIMEGDISLGCNCATWKAYTSCLLGLIVKYNPIWIREVKRETLRKLARGLRKWREAELALSLLEGGGISAMDLAAELLHSI